MPRGYPTIDRQQCSVDDCDRLEVVKGLCRMHYTRLHRHGSTDKPTQRKAPTPGLKRRPRPPSGRAAAYRPGDKIGCYTYLRHGEPRLRAGGRGTRTALIVQCDCGRVSSKLAQEVKPESVYCSPVCPIRAERAASNAPRVAPPKPRKPRIKAAAPKPKTAPAPRPPKSPKPPKPVRQQQTKPPKPAKEQKVKPLKPLTPPKPPKPPKPRKPVREYKAKPGRQIKFLTVLGDAEPFTNKSGVPLEQWRLRCVCGREVVRIAQFVDRGQVSSCGCRTAPAKGWNDAL